MFDVSSHFCHITMTYCHHYHHATCSVSSFSFAIRCCIIIIIMRLHTHNPSLHLCRPLWSCSVNISLHPTSPMHVTCLMFHFSHSFESCEQHVVLVPGETSRQKTPRRDSHERSVWCLTVIVVHQSCACASTGDGTGVGWWMTT